MDTQGKENRFADRLRKLNGMIKGHTGPVVFGAQKAMNKFGIQYNPEIPFQISPSAGAIPEAQLQFNTPTGPIGGQEIVIADPKMLKKVVDAALRTGRDKREEPDVDDVADIKKQISNLPTSPITTRALKLERLININSLAGKTMSIEDLAEALHFMNLKGGLEKDDLDLDLAATKLLVKVAVDSDYPWIEVEEGANIDSNTMVKLEKLPNFDEELPTHTAGAIRYPTIPWLNVQQGLDPSKPMGGMKPGEGPAPEAPKQEMPAEDRIVAALDRFASYADRENIKIPDDPAERERFFDVDIPKIYRAIYGTIQKYMGELDDNTVDRLMQRADAIKDQLAAQWKIDFDAKPDVQEALRLREEIGWSRYNTLMEYYVK